LRIEILFVLDYAWLYFAWRIEREENKRKRRERLYFNLSSCHLVAFEKLISEYNSEKHPRPNLNVCKIISFLELPQIVIIIKLI
jgi:hypothetical protein